MGNFRPRQLKTGLPLGENLCVARSFRQLWSKPLLLLATFFLLYVPISAWTGFYNPFSWSRFSEPFDSPWMGWMVWTWSLALIIIPMIWITVTRVMDLVGLSLAENALYLLGFFFIQDTAFNLGSIIAPQVLHSVSLAALINIGGFTVLLMTLAIVYYVQRRNYHALPPPVASPADLDERLHHLVRVAAVIVAGLLLLPMLVTGVVPLLAADPMQARYTMLSSGGPRALYNFGTAIMPFPAAALLVFILRNRRKNFIVDGGLFGVLFFVQFLSGNRIALAVALVAGLTLITSERRLPRWVFPLMVAGYLFCYTGLSGFTALLRTDKTQLSHENPVVASLREAYLGNNLIDIRDASWVLGNWNYEPLVGRTYLSGLAAFIPSAVFPQRKEWHLGLTSIRIVGWDEEKHFGIRIMFFGESFLNFGWAGVVGLGVIIGTLYGTLLHLLHSTRNDVTPCLYRNLRIVMGMQMCYPLSNTSNAFTLWAMFALLAAMYILVELPARWRFSAATMTVAPRRSAGSQLPL